MPFGLKNATNTFTRMMTEVFQGWMQQFLKVFVDDLNVHNASHSEHIRHLGMVLTRSNEINLKLNPNFNVLLQLRT
jgi:hypothetical protein